MEPGIRSAARTLVAALASVLAAVLVVACGGDDGDGDAGTTTAESGEGAQTATARRGKVRIFADPSGEPAFVEDSARVREGQVRFVFRNPSDSIHSLCVESARDGALGCTSQFRSDASELRLVLERGEHAFYCGVPGHRAAGMEGTLTVR